MKLLGNNPAKILDEFLRETGIEMLPLGDLLANSDFVSLHCDLNPASFHLIAAAELRMMKPAAHLVNTVCSSLIDEAALVDALANRRLAGAALDVFEIEPLPANSPLRAMGNCLLAPHNSNASPTVHWLVHEATVANLLKGLREVERK